ncbi:MAG: IclR family transcriptional regulator [Propioniciclava sp.]|uniref:IclR family transcriptional regulator n=1 Tax=Propioniciclava sp. TaxID=2038686 RepID=UPI0039E6772C
MGVPAADHTLRILSLLAQSRMPMPASMIAAELGLPRSTVYHLLATMQEHGYVMHLAEEKRYGLGIAAVELSSAYARHEPLARVGRLVVAKLVERTGTSGHLAVPHGRDVLYVVETRASRWMDLVSDVDVRLPMQITASGRAILAALPRAQVRALFPNAQAFVHRHPDEISSYSALREVLQQTRARGYSLEQGSVTPGLASVAAPVLDHRAWPVAAVAVTFAEDDVTEDRIPALAEAVRDAAARLSRSIHGRGGSYPSA